MPVSTAKIVSAVSGESTISPLAKAWSSNSLSRVGLLKLVIALPINTIPLALSSTLFALPQLGSLERLISAQITFRSSKSKIAGILTVVFAVKSTFCSTVRGS